MKKIALIAGSLLALTACGSKTVYVTADSTPQSAPETTQPLPRPSVSSLDRAFIQGVIESIGPLYIPESDVIDAGLYTCEFMRSGGTVYELEQIIAEGSYPEFMAAIIVMAIAVYCPDQMYKLEDAYGDGSQDF